jgi:hypothetical protein
MTMPPALQVAVVDIGSKKNIGWAIDGPKSCEGKDIDVCVNTLASALKEGPLALGFEAPMFVPLHQNSSNLTRGRRGEGDRAFTSAVGATVLTSALVVVPYILHQLRVLVPAATATFDWIELPTTSHRLFLFEAFVTHQHATDNDPHIRDAKLAIAKFRYGMRDGLKSVIDEPVCFNLLAATLLRVGWTADLELLFQPCLVVRNRGATSTSRAPSTHGTGKGR